MPHPVPPVRTLRTRIARVWAWSYLLAGVLLVLVAPAQADAAMSVDGIDVSVLGSDATVTWTSSSSGSSELSIARDESTAFNAAGTIQSSNPGPDLGILHSRTVRDLVPGEYFATVRTVGAAGTATGAPHRFVVGGTNTAVPMSNVITDGTVTAMHTYGSETYLAGSFRHVGPYTGGAASLSIAGVQDVAMPVVSGTVNVVTTDGAGGYYIGGSFDSVGALPRNNIAHILPDGGVDPDFDSGPGPDAAVWDIALADGKLYVGGAFDTYAGLARSRIAVVSAQFGHVAASASPGTGFDGTVRAIEVDDANIWVGGTFTSYQGQARERLAVLDRTSLVAKSWNTDIIGTQVNDIRSTSLGMVIGGAFTAYAGQGQANLVAVSKTSGANTGMIPASGAGGTVHAIAAGLTSIYVAGGFSTVAGSTAQGIAALNPTTLAIDPAFTSRFTAGAVVRDIDVVGSTIYVAGDFTTYDTHASHGVAAISQSGAPVTSFAGVRGIDQGAAVSAIRSVAGRVVVGGSFRMFNATPRNGLVKVATDTGIVDQSFQPGSGVTGGEGRIYAIQRTPGTLGDVVYIAGNFTTYNGTANRGNIAKVLTASGNIDPLFAAAGQGANGTIRALAPGTDGYGVFIGGDFDTWRGSAAKYFSYVDRLGSFGGSTFAPPAPDGAVTSLARVGNDLFIGGHFMTIGGNPQRGIAKFDINGVMDPAFDVTNLGATSAVQIIHPTGDGSLFIGGDFQHYQGALRNRIAKIDGATGAAVPGFNPKTGAGVGFDGTVTSMAIAGTRLYVGGNFTTYDSIDRRGFAALSTTSGSLDRTFFPALDAGKRILAMTASGTQALIGGDFTTVDGAHRRGVSLMKRTIDSTPPVGRVYAITDAAPGSSSDGVVVKATRHVVVNPLVSSASFTMKFLAHDKAVSTARIPGSTSGLDRIDWPSLPAARGTWGPTADTTPAAPTGLELDCWDTTTPGSDTTARHFDEAIDWIGDKRPDVTPSLPAILAKLDTQPSPPNGVDRDDISCRWHGYVSIPEGASGSYAFRGRSDGGLRANVQGLGGLAAPWTTVDTWTTPGTNPSAASASVTFGASGARPITAEWFSASGTGIAALEWDPPGTDSWRTVPAQAYASEIYYTRQFTLASGTGAVNGTSTVTVNSSDQAANTTSETFDVSTDSSPPAAPASITTSLGVGSHQSDDITVTIVAPGADVGEAGIDTHLVQRRSLPFAGTDSTTCNGTVDEAGWQTVATWTNQTTWNVPETDVADGCHQYRLVSRDAVGNEARFLAAGIVDELTDWIRVDSTPPAAVTNVLDGDAADIDLVVTSTTAKAHWTAAAGAADTARYEVCLSTLANCTGSVARTWTDVALATSIDWSSLVLTDGATYHVHVRPIDAAGNVGATASSDGFLVDVTPTTATAPTSPARGTLALGGSLNGLLGTLGVLELSATNGVDTIEPCIPLISGSTWTCSWDTTDVLDGSWQVQITALDLLGGGLTIPVGGTLEVDNSGPTHSAITITPATNPNASYASGAGTVWINTNQAGSFHVRVPASDPHGVTYTFPGFGAGWTPASANVGSADTVEYAWLDTVVQPSIGTPLSATVNLTDGVGNTATAGFTVRADITAPASGTIDQHPGITSVPQVDVTPGADAGSGVAGFRVERESAPLLDRDTCDTAGWRGDWTTVSDTGALVVTDTTVSRATCYRYRLVTIDRVGNVRTDVAGGAVVTDQHAILPTTLADITEGSLPGSYSISLHRAPTADVTLDITFDAAQVSVDHAQLVFTPTNYATPQVVYVTALDDSADEDDQHTTLITHTVTSTDPDYGGYAPIVITATIHDVNTAAVRVTAPTYLDIDEADGVGETYAMVLATRPTHPVTISVPGNGQVTTAPTQLEFTPLDWSTPQSVTVTAIDDALVEGRHTVSVAATASSSDPRYHGITVADATARIGDDDEAHVEVESSASTLLAEADANRVATYRVRLTAQPRHPVTITAADLLGQVDLQPASLTIDPAAWNSWHDILVRARQDDVAEPDPHVSRISLTTSSLDQAFDVLAPTLHEQDIVEDDVASYVAALGATWGRSSTGSMQIAEGSTTGATITFTPRTAPTSEITIRPAVNHEARVTVTPKSITIAPGAGHVATFTVQPVDNVVDQPDLDATITWNTSTSDAMYAALRLDDTTFTITDDDEPIVDRTVRDVTTPPAETTKPNPKDPVDDREPTPDRDGGGGAPDSVAPTPLADTATPLVGTPAPDAPPVDPTPPMQDDAPRTEPDTNTDRPTTAPRAERREPAVRRGRVARVKHWAQEHKGAAASAGVATVAIAGAAAKAVAGKGLLGMFKGVPGFENVLDQARHLRPRRFRKDAERLKKLRRRTRSNDVRELHRRRRRRREGDDPMRQIFDRLDGDYGTDGPDILDRIEGNVPAERVDVLDASTSTNAGFELDLGDYDGRAA